jgi:hypothetical protein
MSFQTYIDNIYTKTGKTPEDFLKTAKAKGMVGSNIKVRRMKLLPETSRSSIVTVSINQ